MPFNDDTPQLVFENILKKEIDWPEVGEGDNEIRAEAKDFLFRLLVRDPKERLGAKRGIAELKEHPFLADVNW